MEEFKCAFSTIDMILNFEYEIILIPRNLLVFYYSREPLVNGSPLNLSKSSAGRFITLAMVQASALERQHEKIDTCT